LNCWEIETKETPWRSKTSITREKSVRKRAKQVRPHAAPGPRRPHPVVRR
jgi:hypothetical protein